MKSNNISIKNKLGNLINVSLRDTSIFTNVNSTHLDLSRYIKEDDIESFFNGDKNKIDISINISDKSILTKLNKASDYNEFVEIINDNKIHIPATRLKLLKSNFISHKKECLEIASDFATDLVQRISYVERKAKEIKNDKGSWNLYITRYFFVGQTNNKKSAIKAPIIFYPVEIVINKEKTQITISKLENETILNEKLIIYLLRDSNKENKLLGNFEPKSKIEEIVQEFENNLDIKIKKMDSNLSFNSKRSKEVLESYETICWEDGITFGIYEPMGGKLKQDLEYIINTNQANDVFNTKNLIPNEVLENEELSTDILVQIGKLDIYQKYAIRSAIKQNTIIHGPPGTGKSEVISNIIANILLNGNSAMMISEKKAALDVLEKRLKSLKVFMLQIYDNNDKESFYNSISKLDQFLGRDWLYSNKNVNDDYYKTNNIYVKNKDITINFINRISNLLAFENFNVENFDYITFNKEVEKNWKDKETFIKLIGSNVVDKLIEYSEKLNMNIDDFIEHLESYSKFIVSNHLSSKNLYSDFEKDVLNFIKYKKQFNFDINDIDKIIKIKKHSEYLSNFLSNNSIAEQKLRNDPYSYFNAVSSVSYAIKKTSGIIHPEFFSNLNNIFNKINSFINLLNSCTKSKRKYFFDQFVYHNTFTNIKPISKLFYRRSLTVKDKSILDLLIKINESNVDIGNDFETVYKNWISFDPLVVMYYFNKKIFDSKYINFINNNFYEMNYDLFEIQTQYKFDAKKFDITRKLINIHNEFSEKFPEINDYKLLNETIKDFKTISWDSFDIVIKEQVKGILVDKLSKLSPEEKTNLEKAIHVSNLKRKPGIFKYIQEYKNALFNFFPIWVSRPEQISLYTPLESGIFDYGIFDEASQMFLERAYPLLFRSKTNIVAGDANQLKPSSFFTSRGEEENEDDLELDDLDIQESLLDRAKVTSWNNVILKNHYRSEKKELIQFSNQYIYNNELNYASINSMNDINGIEVINVDGLFQDKCNILEAQKTIELLEDNVNKYETILVITANSNQSLFLTKVLFSKDYNNRNVVEKYLNGKIEIINIENVQGNEADLVIFSICYGRKDKDAKLFSRFGPLIQDGGKNRLNVAITRGKKKMIVVKSIYSGDINVSNEKNINLVVFRNFIEFCDNNLKVKKHLSNEKNKKKDDYLKFDSIFGKDVYLEIEPIISKRNFVVETKYEVGSKKIDIVVINPKTLEVVLGIEIDGWREHQKTIKMIEDIYNQQFLESRGYPIFRVLEFEWKYNKELVLKELYSILNIHGN